MKTKHRLLLTKSIPILLLLGSLLLALYFLVFIGIFFVLGLYDIFQKKHNVLKNYPVVGHFRYLI